MRARAPGKRSRRPRARPVGPGSAGSVRMRARHTAAHEGDGNLFAVPGVAPRRADSADGGIMRARARAGRLHRAEGSDHGSAAGGGAMRTSLRRTRGKATSFHAGVGGRTGNAYGAGGKPSRDSTAAKRLRRGKKRAGVVSRLLDLNMASGGGDHMLLRTTSGRSAGRVSPVAIQGSVGRGQGRRGSEDEPLVVDVDVRQALDQLLRVGMARVEDLTLLRKVRARDIAVAAQDFHRLALETGFREEWRVDQENTLLGTIRERNFMAGFTPSRLARYLQQFADAVGTNYSYQQALSFNRTSEARAPELHRDGSARSLMSAVSGHSGVRRKAAALTALEDHVARMRIAFQSHLKLIEAPLNPTEVAVLRADIEEADARLAAAAKPPPPPQPTAPSSQAQPPAVTRTGAAGVSSDRLFTKSRPSRPSMRSRPTTPRRGSGAEAGVSPGVLSRKETRAEVRARQAEARAAKQAEDAAAAAAKRAAEEKRIRDEAVRRTEQRYEATRLIQRVMRGALGRLRVRPIRNARRLVQLSKRFWASRIQKWVRSHFMWRRWVRVWKAACARAVADDKKAMVLWHTATRNARAHRHFLADAADLPSEPRPPFVGPYPNYRALRRLLRDLGGLPAHMAAPSPVLGAAGDSVGAGAGAGAGGDGGDTRAMSPAILVADGEVECDASGAPVLSSVLLKRTCRFGDDRPAPAVQSLSAAEHGLVQWDAAACIQACVRAMLARRRMAVRRNAVKSMQQFVIRTRYRMIMWWQRMFHTLAQRRQEQLLWKEARNLSLRTWPVEQDMCVWFLNAHLEVERAQKEIAAEKERFDTAWKAYERQVTKRAIKAKIKKHWVPQMDQASGRTYYLNLKTANTQEEHPNLRLARAHNKKQRVKAEAALADRLSVLCEYRDKIFQGEAMYRQQCLDAIRAEAAAAKLCTDDAYDEVEHDLGVVRGTTGATNGNNSGGGAGLFNLVVNAAHHART